MPIATMVTETNVRLVTRPHTKAIVFVVDGDISIRASLERLIWHAGWVPETFGCAEEFLSYPPSHSPSCLVLDLALPDISGLELQKRVGADRPEMPIIFITGQNDVPVIVQAMKAGAAEFLTKPFCDDIVVSALRQALEHSKTVLDRLARVQALRDRYRTLSRREQEVIVLVASGLLNKQVGGELGISEITVKAHRGKVMRKMRASSFADLVNMALSLRLTDGHLDLAGAKPANSL
ncbi:MAG: response regulator transcription factor [Acetobacteraceae bacterium]|nr:response regulator transcription factor [Acetobacteraceae bacterium]